MEEWEKNLGDLYISRVEELTQILKNPSEKNQVYVNIIQSPQSKGRHYLRFYIIKDGLLVNITRIFHLVLGYEYDDFSRSIQVKDFGMEPISYLLRQIKNLVENKNEMEFPSNYTII